MTPSVIVATILNIPWTIIGLFLAIISAPREVKFKDGAVVFFIQSWWWTKPLWWLEGIRGCAYGNTIILGPNEEPRDLEHELVHIEQYNHYPLIFPILHTIETIRFGYRKNRFEDEAYRRAGNVYRAPVV